MSLPEVLLWQALRGRPGGFKFRRQNPQQGYRLDFACFSARLIVEVDGEAHNRGDRPQRDAVRDGRMDQLGFETLRVPATEVLRNLDGDVTGVVTACRARGPLHHRPAAGGPPPCTGED